MTMYDVVPGRPGYGGGVWCGSWTFAAGLYGLSVAVKPTLPGYNAREVERKKRRLHCPFFF